ncbi:pectin methylesterase 1 [Zea mays]|uniref:Pectinesterase n=2 Tax=Zea mays TaxID=4577 RepID=B4FCY2_MAIZE|nr:pectin methylesterase 1 [Zea mays]ACF79975.1 unknown [Zea mays]ACG46952.1 pectinesterase-1 precursor [Zea mays]AQK44030.1 pectin methylesterase1 [Zea mays]|eukprot:NP_001105487.2 pectin methylesterase 1 [Zea mays]
MAKALLGGLSAILVVAVVVGVVATVTRSGKKAGDNFTVPGEASLATSGKSVKSLCAPTLYKESCEKTLSQATNGTENPKEVFHSVAKVALESVQTAVEQSKSIGEAKASDSMTESAREDCKKLLEDAADDLRGMLEMAGGDIKVLFSRSDDLETWLTGVMTFMDTCVDGFVDEKLKADMHSVLRNATELSSNALAITNSLGGILKKMDLGMFSKDSRRRLLSSEQDEKGWPVWMRSPERKLLASGNQPKPNAIVAKDGSGQFKSIQQAVDAVPKGHQGRYVIYVKAGLYDEIVMVPKDKVNIFMYGDGPKQSRVTGRKSFADGITTMKTATFSVEASGFICKNMGFHNTAGAERHQAVALRVQGDLAAFYNCRFDAFQDTLYVHARRQFFRNCVVSGTIDFIFGNSAAVFQNCLIITRRPMDNQQNSVTAHGRTDPNMKSGLVIQNCRLVPDQKLFPDRFKIPSYLGRPWKEFSRLVIMESTIADFVKPEGYMPWNGDFALKTLYYAEYNNRGPGAGTSKRVNWPGFHVIGRKEAEPFTAGPFIDGAMWLKYTGAPHILGFKF